MIELPGWHPDPAGTSAFRWWDGSAWAADPGEDPRIDISTPDRDGFVWSWNSPSRWPDAPTHWFPPGMWEPRRDFPRAPQSWTWWEFGLSDERNAIASGDHLRDSHRPDWFRESENSADLVQMLEEESRDPSAWGEIDLDSIPLEWTPAPGWPETTTGWMPPIGWAPPRSWIKAPPGWNFWQPDKLIVETRRASAISTLDARTRRLLSSVAGTAVTLDQCEKIVCAVVAATNLAFSPLKAGAEMGVYPNESWPEFRNLARARSDAIADASNLRTYILHVRFGVRRVDSMAGPLRAKALKSWRNFSSALNALMTTHTAHVVNAFSARIEVVASRRPAPAAPV